MELVILMFFAFIAGFIDAVVGGGGLIQLPAFFLAYPALPAPVIFGSNKFAGFAGTTVAAVRYIRTTSVPWKAVWPAIVTALVFAVVGARLVSLFDKELMKPVVLGLLIAVAIYTFLKKDFGISKKKALDPVTLTVASFSAGALLGLYDGFFGPGTGSFLIVIYVSVFGFDFLNASVSAKLINCATNLAALAWFAWSGQIRYDLAIPAAVCNMGGAYLGARMAVAKGSKFIRVLFLVVVSGMILKFGWDVLYPYFSS
ncbi:MAG: putative permease [Bacteroidetes bacterium]|nr:MAG: putative permease [Bacteroidota bacterium]